MAGTRRERNESGQANNVRRLLQRDRSGVSCKEYNYVLQITDDDVRTIAEYESALVNGIARFAEIHYNYLFENPDTAETLFRIERNGGNIGEVVRRELRVMLAWLREGYDDRTATDLDAIGQQHYERGVKPVWVLGIYRLLLDHLHQVLAMVDFREPDRRRDLESAIVKMLFRDLGMVMEGYLYALVKDLQKDQNQLELQHGQVVKLLECMPLLFWAVDIRENSILYASPAAEALYGGFGEVPLPMLALAHEDDHARLLCAWDEATTGSMMQTDARIRDADGDLHRFRIAFYPVADRRGAVTSVYCMMEDITDVGPVDVTVSEGEPVSVHHLIVGREQWVGRIGELLATARHQPGTQVVVLTLGINSPDPARGTTDIAADGGLLDEIAGRLKAVVRVSDFVARIDEERFGVVIPMVRDGVAAGERVAAKIEDSLAMPFPVAGGEVHLSVSVGIAVFPDDGVGELGLVNNADLAMYRAREKGVAHEFYDPGLRISPVRHLAFSDQLRHALDNSEFEIHYQPIMDVRTDRVCATEALLRWNNTVEGQLPPARFIPFAEQLGIMASITDWVLVTVLQHSKRWMAAGAHLPVAVNFTARSFHDPGLLDMIRYALCEAEVDGSCLEVEITEAALMGNLTRTEDHLRHLHELGVSVTLDDFGTGFSSLSSLRQLPIRALKIDRSFISGVAAEQGAGLLRSMIDLGHNLGCKVVAEGVESGTAWEMLAGMGCDQGQGYHISRPLPEQNYSSWLSSLSQDGSFLQ
jgi:EAL domain-containing protein (putative c-di-GMP-specific phosphodiesterase class I)/GGDEF domain-containing protein/PAS domain-containing protein